MNVWDVLVAVGARVLRRAAVALLGALVVVVGTAVPAGASHFRYGTYGWAPAGGNSVDFQVQNAFRRSGYVCIDPTTKATKPCTGSDHLPAIGDFIEEDIGVTNFVFGDGTHSPPRTGAALTYQVTAFDPVADFVFGQAIDDAKLPTVSTTIAHTYANAGNVVAYSDSCCRIGANINNSNRSYRVETLVNVGGTNRPPSTNLPPIVDCAKDAVCSFKVPASDPDGDAMRWRFSTPAEAGTGFVQPGAPYATNNASVNAADGTYTWDTTGATLASGGETLYSTQVSVEDVTAAGAVKSKVAVDFFIRLVSSVTPPPTFVSPTPACNSTVRGTVGLPVGFVVKAAHSSAATPVTLNATGLPIGATMSPSLPTTGNPVQSSFAWTPSATGNFVTNFTASTATGQAALCSITIVVDAVKPLTTAKVASASSVPQGGQVGYTISVTNPNNGHVTVSSITDTLPAGFAYVVGSTTGATTANPTISGQNLTWPGAFTVPAGGATSLTFRANVSVVVGTYPNNAGGTSSTAGFSVSPTGPTAPVTVTGTGTSVKKTADKPIVAPSAADGYTITITNASAAAVTYSHIADNLPAGFAYKPGSTTGATTANPTVTSVSGAQVLDWAGSFVAAPNGGKVTLHLGVTASSVVGDYTNEAKATTGTATFTSGATAPVAVRKPLVSSKTADAGAVPTGGAAGYTITLSNPNPVAATATAVRDTLPAGFTYVPGSTSGVTTADPTISGQALTWAGRFVVPAGGSIQLHLVTNASSIVGTYYNAVSGSSPFAVVAVARTAPVVVNAPLTTTKTAAASTIPVNGADAYTIRIANPNSAAVVVDSITDDLPVGFTYATGSTTGATTTDPTVAGQGLTWGGPFTVPANGTLSLTFGVTAPNVPGDYLNVAGGTSRTAAVEGTGPTAQVTVIGPIVTTKTADTPVVLAGSTDGYTIMLRNPNTVPITLDTVTDTLPPHFTYRAGSTSGLTTADPVVTGGSALEWRGITVAPNTVGTIHFGVTVARDAGYYFNNAGGSSAAAPVIPTGNTARITVRSRTVLTANPAVIEAHLVGGQLYLDLSARLAVEGTNAPLAGRTVPFTIGGQAACTGVTDAQGLASCGTALTAVSSVLGGGYDATYDEEPLHLGSTSHGPNVVIQGTKLL